jgi:hypothetical protein
METHTHMHIMSAYTATQHNTILNTIQSIQYTTEDNSIQYRTIRYHAGCVHIPAPLGRGVTVHNLIVDATSRGRVQAAENLAPALPLPYIHVCIAAGSHVCGSVKVRIVMSRYATLCHVMSRYATCETSSSTRHNQHNTTQH